MPESEQPEKLDLRSMDIAAEQREKLRRLFPEVITEGGKVDFDRLKSTLGEIVDNGKERYGMNWPGKSECFRTIQTPSRATLRPCREESVNFDTTENLIIEGDNLEVLKLLQKGYLGKVKMIYIDPPYNTGNDFIYPDNYAESLDTYLSYTGQVDAEGRKFSSNPETDGRFHSKWLNMMYPRLFLARNLLREDGVIFISIDDKELVNARRLCDEIFGEENFEGHIHWRRRHNQPNDPTKMIALVAEHIICYAKYKAALKASGVGKVGLTGSFSNPDNDPRGDWASKPWKVGSDQSGSRYIIKTPAGNIYDEEWMGDEETFQSLLADKRIIFPDKGKGAPRKKYFKSEREEEGQCATNWWPHDQFGHNQQANSEMEKLLGYKNVFSNPKPVSLVKSLMSIANCKEDDWVLDFFAGSGTTGEAVLRRNEEENHHCRFILVQLPEALQDNSANQTTVEFCKELGLKLNIAEITKERIRRVCALLGIAKTQNQNLFVDAFSNECGFRIFKLDTSNFKPWIGTQSESIDGTLKQLELHIDHVLPGRSPEDLLTELLLKSGFPLSTRVEAIQLAGKQVFSVEDGSMLVCLEDKLTPEVIKAMADKKPSRVICLDAGFQGNDQLKTNAVQTMKSRGVLSFRTV